MHAQELVTIKPIAERWATEGMVQNAVRNQGCVPTFRFFDAWQNQALEMIRPTAPLGVRAATELSAVRKQTSAF